MVVKKWEIEKIMLMMPLFVLQTHHPKCVLFLLSYLFSTVTSSNNINKLMDNSNNVKKNVLLFLKTKQLIKEEDKAVLRIVV
jgi:hypothetical protein